MQFRDRYIWITGASSGIGEQLAYQFCGNNNTLILSDINAEGLNKVKEKCKKLRTSAHSFPFDLGKEEEIKSTAEAVIGQFGKIDILINNGGISQRALIKDAPLSLDRRIMEINFFGNIYLTKLVLPTMIANKGGQVVVTSSISGKFGFPFRSAYAASKFALHGFYETLAIEHHKDNISVTLVTPARVRTNISINALTSDGNIHGKMDEGQAKGITPEQCAKEIIRALKRKKQEVFVGKNEYLLLLLKRISPSIFYRIIRKIEPK